MNHKQGFSLVSFLLYLLLLSTIACFMCHSIATLIIPSLQSTKACQSCIAWHISSDLFVRDIRTAEKLTWKYIADRELVWNDGTKDIGWCYHNNKLERSEGEYRKKKWKKKITSTIAVGLSSAIFAIDYVNGKVVGVELKLIPAEKLKDPIAAYVAMRYHET